MAVFAAAPEMLVEFQRCYKALTPQVLAELARGLLPILAEAHRQQLADKLQEEPKPAGDDEDDYEYDDEDYEDEGDDDYEDDVYEDEPDETLTPEWEAALASVAPQLPTPPPPATMPAPAGANGRHTKSPKVTAGAPRDTTRHAPARPTAGAGRRTGVPDGPPPAVNNRRDQRPPRPDAAAGGEGRRAAPGGPDSRDIPPPRPGRNGSAKRR
jgi:hypothetical protein